jgi:hypothetical protein
MQGTKYDVLDNDVKLNLNYINLSLMAKYEVAEGFSLVAGPQIGFLMSAKVTNGDDSFDVKDNFKSIDFGLGLGAEYELENGLFFDARFNLGLSSISDDDNVSTKNSVIQIGLGYSFN